MTTEQELRDRLQIPADYDPDSDGGNLIGRLYDSSDATTLRHLFKGMAWTLLNRDRNAPKEHDESVTSKGHQILYSEYPRGRHD